METDNNLKQIFEADSELGWQLILGNHNCKFIVFGSIGYTIVDINQPPIASVESLFKLDGSKETMRALKGVKMYQNINSSRSHQNFILNVNDENILKQLFKMKHEDPDNLAKLVIDLGVEFFKI